MVYFLSNPKNNPINEHMWLKHIFKGVKLAFIMEKSILRFYEKITFIEFLDFTSKHVIF